MRVRLTLCLFRFSTVLATEGAGAIYKGLKPTLVGTFPEKAIKLGMNDFVRGLLADEKGRVSAGFPSQYWCISAL